VLLISANEATTPYPVYPLGLAVVARALVNAGHEVRQLDVLERGGVDPLGEAVKEAFAEFAPQMVGVSLRNIDNVDSFSCEDNWWVETARAIVQKVRKIAGANPPKIFIGGAGFSLMPGQILHYVGADIGIPGEGERAVVEVVERLARGEEVERLFTGGIGNAVEGDALVPGLIDPQIAKYYLGRTGMLNLQTKRGCPFSCTYCTYPRLEGNRFRVKPVGAVVDELEEMKATLGVGEVFFTDSVFNDAAGNYLELAEELLRREVNIRWCAFFRPAGLGTEELALLKRSGLFAMELGTDAASDATLKGLDKGFTFDEVRRVNEAAVVNHIPAAHFVIFGGPDETEATVEEGLENLASLERSVVFAFSGIRVLPGAPLHHRAVAEGLVDGDDDLLKPVFYQSPQVDREWMNARIEESFHGRRDRIFPPEEGQERLSVMERFGYKGLLWDQLVAFGDRPRRGRAARKKAACKKAAQEKAGS
jgi:radical SAM superfamily enzyme YgiQ (UPF0313 family)